MVRPVRRLRQTADQDLLAAPESDGAASIKKCRLARSKIEELPGLRIWTDSFNNVFQILK